MLDLLPQSPLAGDQKNAQTILYAHGLFKGIQAGSALGLAAGGWIAIFRKKPLLPTMLASGTVGLAIGSVLVPGMIYGRMRGRKELEWQERAWRLQRNYNQLRVDNFSLAGAVGGAIFGVGMKRPLGGAALGTTIGLFAAAAYNKYLTMD